MLTKLRSAVLAAATTAVVAVGSLATLSTSADAAHFRWRGGHMNGGGNWNNHWHGGGNWNGRWHNNNGWYGPAVGFGAGLFVGSLLAQPYYSPYPYYYHPYYAPRPYYRAAYGRSVAWCAAHFRSYSVTSHSYMGYDGRPHACP